MWKLFGWLWKAAAAALLASFLAIWTTGYIVNSYVEALLEEYEIPLEKPPFALSGLWGRLWGVDPGREEQHGGLAADREPIGGFEDARNRPGGGDTANPGAGRTNGSQSRSGGNYAVSEPGGGENGDGRKQESDGSPGDLNGRRPGDEMSGDSVRWRPGDEESGNSAGWRPGDEDGGESPEGSSGWPEADGDAGGSEVESGFGTGPEAHGSAGGSGGAVISSEDLLEAKSRLTDDERNRLFAILVGKVPQEEWQRISEFTEGGLTAEELLQVQQIVATYLNREEYDELMGILNKI